MTRCCLLVLFLFAGPACAQADDRLPAYILELPVSVDAVFVAETETAKLHRFVHASSDAKYRDSRYMSIGQNGVGKKRSWDRRTPLGIFFVSEQLDTSRLHERYGVMAFPLDYPNVWDRGMGRTGDGIWIHGAAPGAGRRPPLDTDGCIALANDELLALADELKPLITPVIITRVMRWLPPGRIELLRSEFRAALDAWVMSYESGDLHSYLSLYADDFTYRGLRRDEWSAFRLQVYDTQVIEKVWIDDVLLLADPEEEGLFLSRFRLTVGGGGQTTRTTKRLYWRRSDDAIWRIVAEDNG